MAKALSLALSDTPALRKARGAFFTPPEMSRFIASWAIRRPEDTILEPSCGEASFLTESADRLKLLGGQPAPGALSGVEIHAASALEANRMVAAHGWPAEITVSDFFDVKPDRLYDAVLGNPPYIRYQEFSGDARAKALEAALEQGVRLNGLASAWAPFVVHASRFLKPNGRLGLVLPAELLAVNYAAEVRRFLLRRFASVRLVMFETLVFPGVSEEVVLLLAEGTGPAPNFEVYQARNLEDLEHPDRATWTWFTPDHGEKWTPALLPAAALEIYREQTSGGSFETMLSWGSTYLGSVTGNNGFFTLTEDRARELKIPGMELLRISPPGSKHLRGLSFTEEEWQSRADAGDACYLFVPDPTKPSAAAKRYIETGEALAVDDGYKCRNRRPWWRVPLVPVPDLLLTYMDHDRPRLTSNTANAAVLNSLYGVLLNKGRKKLGKELLPIASLNSVTLVGAEMVGRAYGGGLLKLEPKEADQLPVPSLASVTACAPALRAIRPQLSAFLRRGDLLEAVKLVDRILLTEQAGFTHAQLVAVREAREILFSRRAARSRKAVGAD